MHIDLSTAEQALFETIKRCADKLSLPCWVIGGFVRDKLLGQGQVPYHLSPARFAEVMKTDTTEFARVIKTANIKVDSN
jgi:tRNA nucleotidyltransferase/poly(A) polymerase